MGLRRVWRDWQEHRALTSSVRSDLELLGYRGEAQELLDAPLQLLHSTHGHASASALGPEGIAALRGVFDEVSSLPQAPAGTDLPPGEPQGYAGVWVCDPYRERGTYTALSDFPTPTESAFFHQGVVVHVHHKQERVLLDPERRLERRLVHLLVQYRGQAVLDALHGDKPL